MSKSDAVCRARTKVREEVRPDVQLVLPGGKLVPKGPARERLRSGMRL